MTIKGTRNPYNQPTYNRPANGPTKGLPGVSHPQSSLQASNFQANPNWGTPQIDPAHGPGNETGRFGATAARSAMSLVGAKTLDREIAGAGDGKNYVAGDYDNAVEGEGEGEGEGEKKQISTLGKPGSSSAPRPASTPKKADAFGAMGPRTTGGTDDFGSQRITMRERSPEGKLAPNVPYDTGTQHSPKRSDKPKTTSQASGYKKDAADAAKRPAGANLSSLGEVGAELSFLSEPQDAGRKRSRNLNRMPNLKTTQEQAGGIASLFGPGSV